MAIKENWIDGNQVTPDQLNADAVQINAALTKLVGIEASADVTDAANVDAAGAVMNSDLTAFVHTILDDADADAVRTTIGLDGAVYVSQFSGTPEAKIEAAITEAATKPNGVVDFGGINYVTTATVTVASAGVTLANGGIVPTGQFTALSVTAADVTVRDMKFSRSTSSGVLDSLAQRSCVSVNAVRFKSFDCNYLAANHACVYLTHGACDGAVIRGGSMTGTSARQDACGVYGASGTTGNKNITVDGVHIHDTTQGVILFDTGYSTVKNCRVEHMRKLPIETLTGWALVTGDIYRQRTAAGAPGTTGVATDREDGNTNVVVADGVDLGGILASASPGANQAGISGGYVYINLGGTNPSTITVTSGIVSGYAYTIYAAGSAGLYEPLTSHNRFINNYAEDCDGFGIYFQLGYYGGAVGNSATVNILKDVCLQGSQNLGLPWAGIAIHSGNDTLLSGNHVDGVGSSGKIVPGIYVTPGPNNTAPRGRIMGTTVRDSLSHGFQITASNWSLVGCSAHDNGDNGFRIWTQTASAVVNNIVLTGCQAGSNAGDGFSIDGSASGIGYVTARIIGGAAYTNTRTGVLIYGISGPTVRDCAVIGMRLWENGNAAIPQLRIREFCYRTTIDDCHMVTTTSGAIGLQVESAAADTIVGNNQYSMTTPESLAIPVRAGGALAGARWRGAGSPEGVVVAPIGATYQRSNGSANTTLYVKESGTSNTGWIAVSVIQRTVQTVTTTTTLGATGDYVIFIGASGAPTLPTAVGNTSRYSVNNIHSADRVIATTSSQTINGATTHTLVPSAAVDLISDGANWRIF